MLKSAIISFVALVGGLLLISASLMHAEQPRPASTLTPGSAHEVQTGTAFDNPPPPPCTEDGCAKYVEHAVDRQWQTAAADILESLGGCRAFTPKDRQRLKELERSKPARSRYLLRLAALTQLAQKTTT